MGEYVLAGTDINIGKMRIFGIAKEGIIRWIWVALCERNWALHNAQNGLSLEGHHKIGIEIEIRS